MSGTGRVGAAVAAPGAPGSAGAAAISRPGGGAGSAAGRRPARTRVVSPGKSAWSRVGELWRSRELLVYLVRKELAVKYKNSALGFLWSMLNPALMLAVYYFVFQIVLGAGIPHFAVFLMCGLLVWNLFSTAVPNATTSVVANSGIVKKVAFPREILAVASVGASLVFFALQSLVLVGALVIFRLPPAPSYLPLLVPAMAALLLFSAALAVFLSAVNVYFRDTQHLLEVALLAWFWATPIVYSYRSIADRLAPHHLTWILFLNPITPIVLAFQRAIYGKVDAVSLSGGAGGIGRNATSQHSGPTVLHILPAHGPYWYLAILSIETAVSLALLFGALTVFGRLEGNFAEEL